MYSIYDITNLCKEFTKMYNDRKHTGVVGITPNCVQLSMSRFFDLFGGEKDIKRRIEYIDLEYWEFYTFVYDGIEFTACCKIKT